MKMIEINDEEPLRGVKIKIYPTASIKTKFS